MWASLSFQGRCPDDRKCWDNGNTATGVPTEVASSTHVPKPGEHSRDHGSLPKSAVELTAASCTKGTPPKPLLALDNKVGGQTPMWWGFSRILEKRPGKQAPGGHTWWRECQDRGQKREEADEGQLQPSGAAAHLKSTSQEQGGPQRSPVHHTHTPAALPTTATPPPFPHPPHTESPCPLPGRASHILPVSCQQHSFKDTWCKGSQ